MHAFILAAGFGTRLRPLTEKVPKPLIQITSEPLIEYQIRWLRNAGINDIVINLHHLGSQIEEYLKDGSNLRVNIAYSWEDTILETGGGIFQALPLLKSDPFVVLNGDVWTNYSFKPDSIPSESLAHLVLVPNPKGRSFGDFSLDGPFIRRPAEPSSRNLTFSGISFLRHKLFKNKKIEPFSLTRELLFDRLDENCITGEIFNGTWIDIGTPETLKQVRRMML